ncbi:MAG: DotU family type IV/VI secretion system protein [Phycisphaerales bacterium]|nr:DotU family type IV/VI secretion system protein [Phycisphaerales bacterium]
MREDKIAIFCRPLFTMICAWSDESAAGTQLDAVSARTSVMSQLDTLRSESRRSPQLGRQFLMTELPLLFFVDFVMKERLPVTGTWQELAFERNELAGDEKFFDLLEQTLGDPSELATERVQVYYDCMALGFSGAYRPDAPELDRLFRRCALRLGLAPELVETGRVTPEAYEHRDARTRRRPMRVKRWRMAAAVCLVGFLATYIANQAIFRLDVNEPRRRLEGIASAALRPDLGMSRVLITEEVDPPTGPTESTGTEPVTP